ncbi:MAG: tyrosine-type recombinase/integrase [Lachnospiraceae bacterium]|nr:tyrosine-type recombinase/integrase [Lachnospiraceae bacterium]
MRNTKKILTPELMETYFLFLRERERADNTIRKYRRDLTALCRWLDGRHLTKERMIEWKECLTASYAAVSVNSMLAAAQGFLRFMGWQDMSVRPLKIQKNMFRDESRELTRKEYIRLVETSRRGKNERLALVLQSICATGIRVSELSFITVRAVRAGRAVIRNKGKWRTVFLPAKLCGRLKAYLRKEGREEGSVFVTRTGRPLDRSNIWREMKRLCESADVLPKKVFPHNLRHLFARTYYSIEKDISRLADILGHSDIGTTRIYTRESGRIHARQLERMGLVIT